MDKDQRQFLRSTLIVLAPTLITLTLLMPAVMLGGGSYGSLLVGASIGQWIYGVWWSQVHPALVTYLDKKSREQDWKTAVNELKPDVPVSQQDREQDS